MEGGLPREYVPDLLGRKANLLTFRRWLFEVSGLMEDLQDFCKLHERQKESEPYLPRRARTNSGEEVALEPYLDAWVEQGGPRLVLTGPEHSGKTTVLEEARYRAARRFLRDPENVIPLIEEAEDRSSSPKFVVVEEGMAVPMAHGPMGGLLMMHLQSHWRCIAEGPLPPRMIHRNTVSLELLVPSSDEIVSFIQQHLTVPLAEMFSHARRNYPDLDVLASALSNIDPLLAALRQCETPHMHEAVDSWVALLVVAFVNEFSERWFDDATWARLTQYLETAALQQFGFGSLSPIRNERLEGMISVGISSWFDLQRGLFHSHLLRDYFLAHKLMWEVRGGNEEIVLRYQFPPFVFLILTQIAPEIAARLGQSRVARLEERIEGEVERKLQLTFAHLLNHPVGRMRSLLSEIREGLGKDIAMALARPLARLDKEIDYIASLAERTRMWQTRPEETLEGVALAPLAEEIATPLREKYPTVGWRVSIEAEMQAQAMRQALGEALYCLLENAVHAAVTGTSARAPMIEVTARRLGEVLRLEIRDSGPGIAPGDRERIFEPLVTTKKGGTGKPLGTGLGLPIARRYVEAMQGRVGLDADQEITCFYIDLVPWKENA